LALVAGLEAHVRRASSAPSTLHRHKYFGSVRTNSRCCFGVSFITPHASSVYPNVANILFSTRKSGCPMWTRSQAPGRLSARRRNWSAVMITRQMEPEPESYSFTNITMRQPCRNLVVRWDYQQSGLRPRVLETASEAYYRRASTVN
jgi:hypothetical protein